MVAHAAWVERTFLQAPLRPHGRAPARTLIDTTMLWRLLCIDRGRPDPGYTHLGTLAAELGLPAHRAHHALGDALTTAQVFLALATHLEAFGRRTVPRTGPRRPPGRAAHRASRTGEPHLNARLRRAGHREPGPQQLPALGHHRLVIGQLGLDDADHDPAGRRLAQAEQVDARASPR